MFCVSSVEMRVTWKEEEKLMLKTNKFVKDLPELYLDECRRLGHDIQLKNIELTEIDVEAFRRGVDIYCPQCLIHYFQER